MNTAIFCLIIVATLTSQGCFGQNQQESEIYGQPLLMSLLENFRNKANFVKDETIHNVSSISKDIVHHTYDKLREALGQIKGLSQKAINVVQTNADKIKKSTESKLQEAARAKEVEFRNLMNSLKDESVRELNGVVQTSHGKLENKTVNLISLLEQKTSSINQNLRQVIKDTYRVESDNKWKAIKSSSMEEMKSEVDREVKLQVNSFLNQQFGLKLNNFSRKMLEEEEYHFNNFGDQLKIKIKAEIQEATAEIDHKLNEYSNKIQGLRINLNHLISDMNTIDARLQSKNNNGDHNQMVPDNSHINPNLINNSHENTNRDIGHGTFKQLDVNPDFVNNPYENTNRDIHETSEQPDVNPDFVNNPYENTNRDIGHGTFRRPEGNPDFVNNPYENSNRDIHETSEQPDVNPDFVNNLPHGNNDDGLKNNENDLSSADLDELFDGYRLPDVMV